MRIRDRTSPCIPIASFLSLVLMTGCSRDLPVSPPEPDGSFSTARAALAPPPKTRGFFPLAIGNRWHVVAEDRATLTPSDGGPAVEQFVVHTDISRELIGTETISGTTYVLERDVHVSTSTASPNPSTYTTWVRYRQDADGLYEAEVTGPPAARFAGREAARPRGAIREFPASLRSRLPATHAAAYEKAWDALRVKIASLEPALAAPPRASGVMPGEITRLEYPLHPGAEWTIRTVPSFWCEVERMDHLDLPAGRFSAYRLRIRNEFMGENDRVHLWMGRSGQLQLVYQVETIATDENGNEIGRIVADHQEAVDLVSLVRP